ncbi:MAG: hypothetical protein ACE5HO_09960 [bacterium]
MNWKKHLPKDQRYLWIVGSFVLFLSANLIFCFYVLQPARTNIARLRMDISEMTESYVELRSINIIGVLANLRAQTDLLQERQSSLLASRMSESDIPVVLSNLQKQAISAGLTTKGPTVHYATLDQHDIVSIDLSLVGSFQEILDFLRFLRTWKQKLLINDLSMKLSDHSPGWLTTRIKLVALVTT